VKTLAASLTLRPEVPFVLEVFSSSFYIVLQCQKYDKKAAVCVFLTSKPMKARFLPLGGPSLV
jgi:hypothetical protein